MADPSLYLFEVTTCCTPARSRTDGSCATGWPSLAFLADLGEPRHEEPLRSSIRDRVGEETRSRLERLRRDES